jgi:hypothetical protein
MTQIMDIGGIRDREQQCILGVWWKDQRFAYTDANLLEYKGCHAEHDAADTDENWVVWKYTYSTTYVVRIEGPLVGAWHDHATLAWGA